jgi:hypothetical protein
MLQAAFDQFEDFAALRRREFQEHLEQTQTVHGLRRHRALLFRSEQFVQIQVRHIEPFNRDVTMAKQEKMELLANTIDEAIARAEQLGLTFVVFILDMARVEVDQTERDSLQYMATN